MLSVQLVSWFVIFVVSVVVKVTGAEIMVRGLSAGGFCGGFFNFIVLMTVAM